MGGNMNEDEVYVDFDQFCAEYDSNNEVFGTDEDPIGYEEDYV